MLGFEIEPAALQTETFSGERFVPLEEQVTGINGGEHGGEREKRDNREKGYIKENKKEIYKNDNRRRL